MKRQRFLEADSIGPLIVWFIALVATGIGYVVLFG